MGTIRKIKENELYNGTSNTDVYPITSTRAVLDANNVSVEDKISNLDARVTNENERNNAQDSNLFNINNSLGQLQGKVASLEMSRDDTNDDVDALQAITTEQESNISTINSHIQTLYDKVFTVQDSKQWVSDIINILCPSWDSFDEWELTQGYRDLNTFEWVDDSNLKTVIIDVIGSDIREKLLRVTGFIGNNEVPFIFLETSDGQWISDSIVYNEARKYIIPVSNNINTVEITFLASSQISVEIQSI